ncbi:hypothetical protein MMC25_001094 [Agyrium rufum]|nr:hypothetical protein [Agyrium rufum]
MKVSPALTALSLLLGAASALPAVEVSIANKVCYIGYTNGSVDLFNDIQYGQDPSGAKRFTVPQAFVPKARTAYNASQEPAACIQPSVSVSNFSFLSTPPPIQSENCLNLRIVRPAGTKPNAKLPTVVYLFGGGFSTGHDTDALYTPNGFVQQSVTNGNPIIYVSLNYRLGIFGFADTQELYNEKALNLGLRDQRLALEWVQKNIGYFGGNPKAVTLMGQSTGAFAAGLQLTAFAGKTTAPFQRLISQSGSAQSPITNSTVPAVATEAVAAAVNCTQPSDSVDLLTCLRNVPVAALQAADLQYTLAKSPPSGFNIFIPTLDGDFIPEEPSVMIRNGLFPSGIELLTGWVKDDGSIFTPPILVNETQVEGIYLGSRPNLTPAEAAQIIAQYPLSDFPSPYPQIAPEYFQASRIFRDFLFACPALDLALETYKKGANVYIYEFNTTAFTPFFIAAKTPFYQTAHISEIPYVFNEVAQFGGSAADIALAQQVSGSWSSFIAEGNPSTVSNKNSQVVSNWPVGLTRLDVPATGENVTDASVQILGGPNPGTENLVGSSPLALEDLVQRCGFYNNLVAIGALGV